MAQAIKGCLASLKETLRINPALVTLKCALFLFFGGMSAIAPYITVHMKSIGLRIDEIGTISAFLPIAAFVGPPLAGMLSDKLGQYRFVLIFALVSTGITQTLMLLPDARVPDGFESFNATGILKSNLNETTLEFEDISLETNATLAAFRFTVLDTTQNASCLAFDKSFELEVSTSNNSMITGVVKETVDKDCQFELKVNVTAVKVVDLERDAMYHAQHMYGFWLYFIIRMVATATITTCFCLFDAIVLAMVKEHNGDYGKQRFFSMLGFGVVSPLSGLLVDWFSAIQGYRDYSGIFYLSDVFLVIVIFLVWKLDVKSTKVEGSFLKNLTKLVTIPEIPVFLFFMFLLGNNWGYTENYLFIFLLDLKAPNYLLGLTVTVGALCGLPFLSFANKLIAKVGITNMLLLSFVAYTVRFIGYSFIEDPWMTLFFEALKFLSYHLLQCSACTFCSLKAPKGLLATLTTIYGASHYQLGRASGAFIGGLLIPHYGVRETFRIFAYAATAIGILYWLIDYFILRRIERRRDLARARRERPDGEFSEPFLRR